MRIRNPKNIHLGLLDNDKSMWDNPDMRHKCDDPACTHKTISSPKLDELEKWGVDKNKNGVPDMLEGKNFNFNQKNLVKKVKKWI